MANNDPEEKDARATAAAEVADRLRRRGITVTGAERSDDLADLLSAVERFEKAVEAHGGDLMVDDLKSASRRPPFRAATPRARRGRAHLHQPHRRRDGRLRTHPRRTDYGSAVARAR